MDLHHSFLFSVPANVHSPSNIQANFKWSEKEMKVVIITDVWRYNSATKGLGARGGGGAFLDPAHTGTYSTSGLGVKILTV